MKLIKLDNLINGERVVAVKPPLATRVDECWNRRLRFYTGRTLTHTALNIEQQHHSNHLAMYGRQISAGIVHGLEVGLELPEQPGDPAWVHIAPGLGISANGEDIHLSVPMRVEINKLPVLGQDPNNSNPPQGVGILLLQPIFADIAGEEESTDPCEIDPADDAFADWRLIDGCRLVWFPWPEDGDWDYSFVSDENLLRNILSYIIFEKEAQLADEILPWEREGVPLALVYIRKDSLGIDDCFVDRYAVMREGGSPLSRQSLVAGAGNPFLWQARMQNFSAHMEELQKRGIGLEYASDYFHYLPPVGVLPREVIDWTKFFNEDILNVQFLPPWYLIDAVPIPLEQFEIALEASASLVPFDISSPFPPFGSEHIPGEYIPMMERLQILVPVEQSLYEPRLLHKEDPDDIFQQTVAEFLDDLNMILGKREMLRMMAEEVQGAIDKELIPEYHDTDPEAVSGESPTLSPPPDVEDYAGKALEALHSLYTYLSNKYLWLNDELGQINPGSEDHYPSTFIGLSNFVNELEEKLKASDDTINFGFVRLHTDIYRIRQIMLSNVQATRLATSPVLATIAQGVTNLATQEQLRTYFTKAIQGGSTSQVYTTNSTSNNPGNTNQGVTNIQSAVADYSIVSPELTETTGMTGTAADYITMKSPIIGKTLDIRSSTIAERIDDPQEAEAKNYAIATKAEVIESLAKLPINVGDIKVSMTTKGNTAILTKDQYDDWFDEQGFDEYNEGHPELDVLYARTKIVGDIYVIDLSPFTTESNPNDPNDPGDEVEILGPHAKHLRDALDKLLGSKHPLSTSGLSGLILAGTFDPDITDADEATFLLGGVGALENTVSALRKVEGRIYSYRKAITRCKKTLQDLTAISEAWQKDLLDIDHQLAEVRHNYLVAQSLKAEEEERVQVINDRRREILDNHVPFLAYIRPRTNSLRLDAPSVKLYAQFEDPVPACFNKQQQIPEELKDMLELFWEVPVQWLPEVGALVAEIEHLESLRNSLVYSRQKAQYYLSEPISGVPLQTSTAAPNKYGKTVSSVYEANKAVTHSCIQQRAALNLQGIERMTWRQASVKAQETLTLSDLLETGRGKSNLAKKAALEMEHIEGVAGCFYTRCGDVTPAVRLRWADKISIFDKPINLQNLEVLPGWSGVDFDLRRDMQSLIDWLFSRIDKQIPQAVSLMNDLVRVCILLASHAPVSSIINGHVPKRTVGKVGDVIDLVIDRGKVGVGMQVAIYAAQHVSEVAVQGIVEDLTVGAARVRVTMARDATFEIAENVRANFLPPGTLPKLSYV